MTDKKLNRSSRLTGLFALLALLSLSSCEKVIDIDLNKAEKKYVVEATVTDQTGARVLLSQTKDFEDDNTFVGIGGAIVQITEQGGATTTLSETSAGVYEAPALIGLSGKTYSLSVKLDGQSFTAVTTMPQKINLDTIYVTDELLFGDTYKIVNLEYKDPPGRGQNYRFVQYLNGVKETEIFVQNDEYTDGRNVTTKLFYFPDDDEDEKRKIKSGDQVRIDMFCIDANIYKYWFSLYRSSTGESQATPSNPVSNMKGGALGYFSAHTTQTKTMVAP